jgi:prepilin-type N-terminal cleavage/methylation domain-containing protein
MLTRRGFTLIELIVALTIGTLVLGAVYQAIVGIQRLMASHSERIEMHQGLRAGGFYFSRALRDVDAADGDIIVANSAQIRFRAMTWSGMNCRVPTDQGTHIRVYLRDTMTYGVRGPDATLDSILLFYQGDPRDGDDDTWIYGRINQVTAFTCTDGAAATEIRFNTRSQTLYATQPATPTIAVNAAQAKTLIVNGVLDGAPIRGFHETELNVQGYWDGRPWIMHRTMTNSGSWSGWQGLLGPLQATDGLELTYYDATGTVTAVLTNIASIGITLRAESNRRAQGSTGNIEYLRDSLTTHVAFRN